MNTLIRIISYVADLFVYKKQYQLIWSNAGRVRSIMPRNEDFRCGNFDFVIVRKWRASSNIWLACGIDSAAILDASVRCPARGRRGHRLHNRSKWQWCTALVNTKTGNERAPCECLCCLHKFLIERWPNCKLYLCICYHFYLNKRSETFRDWSILRPLIFFCILSF